MNMITEQELHPSLKNKINKIETIEKDKTKNEELKLIKKEIDSLKSHVDNGKSELYSAIIDKKVTPKSKEFNALVQGVKDIKLVDNEQNKKYESQIKDLQNKNNQSQSQINQLKNDKSNLENKIASIKPAKGNAQPYQVSEHATFTNENGQLQQGALKVTTVLNVTPSNKQQQFNTGIYGSINVSPITSDLVKNNLNNDQLNQIMKDKEPNLKPENIANGVTISGITGTNSFELIQKEIKFEDIFNKEQSISIDMDIMFIKGYVKVYDNYTGKHHTDVEASDSFLFIPDYLPIQYTGFLYDSKSFGERTNEIHFEKGHTFTFCKNGTFSSASELHKFTLDINNKNTITCNMETQGTSCYAELTIGGIKR